jgi:hypothetical protein
MDIGLHVDVFFAGSRNLSYREVLLKFLIYSVEFLLLHVGVVGGYPEHLDDPDHLRRCYGLACTVPTRHSTASLSPPPP